MPEPTTIETDVLIIGGGGAGARAAIEASDLGLNVVLMAKGILGKSGCSIFAGNLNWFAPPEESSSAKDGSTAAIASIDKTVEFWAKYTHYLGDQEYFKRAAPFLYEEFYPWLEQLGAYFLRKPTENGSVVVTDLPRQTQAWLVRQGLSGQIIMELIRGEVLKREISLLEETSALDLLVDNGCVVGAVALDYRRGEFLIIRAKAVILATGHNNYLSSRSTGTREGAANGWAIGFRAGVPLQDIEIQWYHVSDIAAPRSWMRLHLYPNPMPDTSDRTRLLNSDGEVFYDGNDSPGNPVPYIMQMKALIRQVQQGRARFDGGYYTSYQHVDPSVFKNVAPLGHVKRLGLDPTRDLIENAVTWHMNVGGLSVDGRSMESCLDGLYIAGSVSALITGGIGNVVYDGIVAARSAAERCGRVALAAWDRAQALGVCARIGRHLDRPAGGGLLPAQVKEAIRDVMWQYAGPLKSAAGLNAGLEALDDIRLRLLPQMELSSQSKLFNVGATEIADVEDMLVVCDLVFRASLARQESRGSFFREDFPYTDNANWLRHTVITRTASGPSIETVPVELPYVRPLEEGRVDYFTVDY
jgi:succinate dehydrogenase / fumarate reductase flavoprotein subunit